MTENTAVVGVRSAEEVFAALEELDARCRPFTEYEQGPLEAYRWAAGALTAAPVTAAATAGPWGPCRAQMLAECQAAAVAIPQERTGRKRRGWRTRSGCWASTRRWPGCAATTTTGPDRHRPQPAGPVVR
ncbi:hypothetical protein [Kitasatospora cinereorecta]|uniref:hypothetical protein n=1 Tax=Kitasatospora cinereorecta TaxID=285560 RepID=UPI0031F7F32B